MVKYDEIPVNIIPDNGPWMKSRINISCLVNKDTIIAPNKPYADDNINDNVGVYDKYILYY